MRDSYEPFFTFQPPSVSAPILLSLDDQCKAGYAVSSYHELTVSSSSSFGQLRYSMTTLVFGFLRLKSNTIPFLFLCSVLSSVSLSIDLLL